MKNVATLVILLAGVLACKAHDTNLPADTKGWRSNGTASRLQNSSNLRETEQHSVVVNWLLVCEDLCGAGYGGPICGKHCNAQNKNQTNNAKYKSTNLCWALCDFGLGGKNCDCKENQEKPPKNAKDVCNVICRGFNISIAGCSTCFSFPSNSYHKTRSAPDSIQINDRDSESSTDSASITTIDSTPDTPDWSVLCIELCKKGEGGALCNCDLPPLSMKL